MTTASIVGTWRLRAWESIGANGSVTHPMGRAPEGVLVYTPDGTMITTIGAAGRAAISAGDLLDGPADERLGAMATFIAYAGTYAVNGATVVHHVQMSLFPNWAGTSQTRNVELRSGGRELILSTDLLAIGGRAGSQRLTWVREGDA